LLNNKIDDIYDELVLSKKRDTILFNYLNNFTIKNSHSNEEIIQALKEQNENQKKFYLLFDYKNKVSNEIYDIFDLQDSNIKSINSVGNYKIEKL
jgi:hypothetical protein